MTVTYSVTFEFDQRPPLTHTGTITAGQASTCFARAAREAKRALKPRGWTSIVILVAKTDTEASDG